MVLVEQMLDRAMDHDASKLKPPELDGFVINTPKLKNLTYGSPEYHAVMAEMKESIDHHYKENTHHPEHWEEGIKGMDLIDLLEMIADWKAATMRHTDGDILNSIEINQKRFGYSNELKSILKNTIERYFK